MRRWGKAIGLRNAVESEAESRTRRIRAMQSVVNEKMAQLDRYVQCPMNHLIISLATELLLYRCNKYMQSLLQNDSEQLALIDKISKNS